MPLPLVDENFLRSVISDASEQFHGKFGGSVGIDAQMALLERAIEHTAQISQELTDGRTTRDAIVRAAVSQLNTAAQLVAEERATYVTESTGEEATNGSSSAPLTREDVEYGMKIKCHWIPWC